jgi:hypothetical protein
VNHVPASWLAAPIVHLAPLMSEASPGLAALFQGRVVGATAQGWLRRASAPDGAVVPMPHALDDVALEGFAALFLSEEDVGGDERVVDGLHQRVPVVVLTRGAHGCVLYAQGRRREIPAYPANEVDGTGAGDVFAAAFLTHLEESADPEASARFAACAAALSVEGVGTQAIPTREQVQARL